MLTGYFDQLLGPADGLSADVIDALLPDFPDSDDEWRLVPPADASGCGDDVPAASQPRQGGNFFPLSAGCILPPCTVTGNSGAPNSSLPQQAEIALGV